MNIINNVARNDLIGERVRYYRKEKRMSLDVLGKSIPTPITAQQLARYETGQSRWPADLLVDITIILGVDVRLLTGLEDGKHEGKESEEWDAEKYKMMMLRMPVETRQMVYNIIENIIRTPQAGLTGGESAA